MVLTGTGTGVGKTVVTAAVAALALEGRRSVAVLKPAQTGVGPDEPGDLAEVERLAGSDVTTWELGRFPGRPPPARAPPPGSWVAPPPRSPRVPPPAAPDSRRSRPRPPRPPRWSSRAV